ncbi:MAG: hypothetical protein NVSMB47_03600 [Polyangiales bacterium]
MSLPLRRGFVVVARSSLVALSSIAALSLVACSSSNGGAPPGVTDSGTDAPSDDAGPPPCTLALNKGPWALAIDETSAKVRWESCFAAPTTLTFTPEAGGAPKTLTSVVTATVVTHTNEVALAHDADFAGTYYMNEVALTGLDPSTCYTYALAADSTVKARVCTARKAGDDFAFMALGDSNPGLGITPPMIATAYATDPADFTLHGGDIQYYSSGLETYGFWMQKMAPMLRGGAFLPAIGNHENENEGEKAEYYDRYWGGAGFDGTSDWYRFESGGVWFFAIDTEADFTRASAQGSWLEAQLADASKKPGFRFSVPFFHRPFVTCGDTSDAPDLRAQWTSTFQKYGVKLVVQAHMHGYERFELDGMTYLTAAGGGGALGNYYANESRPECLSRKASGRIFHTVRLAVKKGQLVGTVVDDKGDVRDSFTEVVP